MVLKQTQCRLVLTITLTVSPTVEFINDVFDGVFHLRLKQEIELHSC